jgi:hypothetical protein
MWLWSKYIGGWQTFQRREESRSHYKGIGNRGGLTKFWLLFFLLWLGSTVVVQGFTVSIILNHVRKLGDVHNGARIGKVWMSESGNYFHDDAFPQDDDDGGEILEDLNWRVVKLKLEEENTKRFLKSKPRYLPYEECRKWVTAWNRWSSEKEWYDFCICAVCITNNVSLVVLTWILCIGYKEGMDRPR